MRCQGWGTELTFFCFYHNVDFAGLSERYLNGGSFGPKKQKAQATDSNLTAEYPYLDESGIELFRVRRYEDPPREKTFRQGVNG